MQKSSFFESNGPLKNREARTETNLPRGKRKRFVAFVAALALLVPWGYGDECPHQGRSPIATTVNATSSDTSQDCSTGQSISALGISSGSGSAARCPFFTTSGITFNPPTGKWYHRVTELLEVHNTRTDYQCNTLVVLWGLYSGASCEIVNTSTIQTEQHTLSDAFCPAFLPPPVTPQPAPPGRPGPVDPPDGPVQPRAEASGL